MTLTAPFCRRLARLTPLALLMLLGACATVTGLIGQARVDVLGGAVTVAAPRGYCVGPGEVEEADDTAVVLIGRCLSTGFVAPAVISVSLGRAGSSGVMLAGDAALAEFFASDEGRGLLARSGDPADVTLIGTETLGDAFLLHLNDRMLGEYWRAIQGLNGRLVTVSAIGTGGVALPVDTSRKVVGQALRALRMANGLPAGGRPLFGLGAPAVAEAPLILPDAATAAPPARPVALPGVSAPSGT
jgi:hypothetical protein